MDSLRYDAWVNFANTRKRQRRVKEILSTYLAQGALSFFGIDCGSSRGREVRGEVKPPVDEWYCKWGPIVTCEHPSRCSTRGIETVVGGDRSTSGRRPRWMPPERFDQVFYEAGSAWRPRVDMPPEARFRNLSSVVLRRRRLPVQLESGRGGKSLALLVAAAAACLVMRSCIRQQCYACVRMRSSDRRYGASGTDIED